MTQELIERLHKLADRQRRERGDAMYLGEHDPEISEAADTLQSQSARIAELEGEAVTELDGNGEAMICEGCGTTRTIAAILARHGPKAIACCPDRKMVEARHFWRASLTKDSTSD